MGCITLSCLSIILGIRAGLPDPPSRVGVCLVRPSAVGAACSPRSGFTLSFGSMNKMMHFHVMRFWNCSIQLPYPPCSPFLQSFSQNTCSDLWRGDFSTSEPDSDPAELRGKRPFWGRMLAVVIPCSACSNGECRVCSVKLPNLILWHAHCYLYQLNDLRIK